jgi:glycosyltransferase involved in cell wall biosynthesis
MRIGLVASTYPPRPGGLERHVDRLARGLAARGAEVEVLTQHPDRRLPAWSEVDGVVVRRFIAPLGNGHGALSASLCDHLRRTARSFDLVHVHTAHAPLALAVARMRPRRLVFTPHAPIQRLLRWPYTWATGAVLQHALRTAPTSTAEGDLIRRRFPRAAARVRVVPTGVDAAAIVAAQPLPDTPDSLVLAVGRLERYRRVDRIIAAIAGLPPAYRLAVVGSGPARRGLEARAADLCVTSRIQFVGAVPEDILYRWLRTSQVVVSVSELEASGIAVMEALSAGAPVVVSDTVVHREAASWFPGAPVLFVPNEASPLRIADAIDEASRMRVPPSTTLAAPSWEAVVDGNCALYEELLSDTLRRRVSPSNGARPGRASSNGRDPSLGVTA